MVRDLNDYYMDYLEHFGVKGMKWGVQRAKRREKKERKNYLKAKQYKSAAKYLDSTIKPGSSLQKARTMARSAKYQAKADKLIRSVSKETLSKIKTEEKKHKEAVDAFYKKQEMFFEKHMSQIEEEMRSGNTSRHPGLL